MHVRSRNVAREIKSGDRPNLYAGTVPLDGMKATLSIAANHGQTLEVTHIDVLCASFFAQGRRPLPMRLPVVDERIHDTLLRKSMHGTADATCDWECD